MPSPGEINPLVTLFNARHYAELEYQARALLGLYPESGFVWKLLGAALQMQRKEALSAFQKTAELMPNDAEAHFNLGVVQKSLGQLDDAVTSYRAAVKIKTDYAEAHANLGNTLKELGLSQEAANSYRRALQLQPNYVDTHFNLGNTLKELGRFDEAIISYRHALELQPAFAEAHNNLGATLKELGRFDEAAASYRRLVELKPDSAEAHNNLGVTLKYLHQVETAVASYRRAIQLKPDYAEAHYNLGIALMELEQVNNAAASYRSALQLKPDYTEAYYRLGYALNRMGQFEAAVASHRKAIELQPDHIDAHCALGVALLDLMQIDDALASFRQALALAPDCIAAQSSLLFIQNYAYHLSPADCLEEARQYGRLVTSKATTPFSSWLCNPQPDRLRVGIVSADLNTHPVGYFLESLLPQLDPEHIELIAYPTNPRSDALTAHIKPYFSAWHPLLDWDDDAATAQLIHSDGVHILLDLSGHTNMNRLPIFAWRPAPVQASWLGYFATTGVAEIDYFLADNTGVPAEQCQHFTETIRYLPDTRLCFSAPQDDVPVAPLPALSNGYITFGCFQNLSKMGENVLALWSEILTALPDARLRLQSKQLLDAGVAAQLLARFQLHGIAPARVALHGMTPRTAYLAAHAEVDILLDTFPYTGGTTTCEALWMGVPTLTLAGDTLLARQGASLLSAACLNDWITNAPAEYVERAIALASDLPKLAALRSTLREQVLASPLFDAPRFARNLQNELWAMWQDKTRQ